MIRWRDLSGRTVRVLRGVKLPCGCLSGIYETYAGATVVIIDEADVGCLFAQHRNGYTVGLEAGERPATESSRR